MSSGLSSLLNPSGALKPRKPRPPVTTRPRPQPTSNGGGGRVTHYTGGLSQMLDPKHRVGASASIAPAGNERNVVTHNPSTGSVQAKNRMLSVPVSGYRISTPFGPRIHPITGRPSNHTGMDLAVGMGTPIYAPRSGVIEQTNANDSIYGNQVVMRNGPHLETMYGHMQKYAVEPGQRLKRGDLIGYVGSTGLSTGPHLHWETWKNGTPVNPADLYDPNLPRRLPKIQHPQDRPGKPKFEEPDIDPSLATLLGSPGDIKGHKPQAPKPRPVNDVPGLGNNPRLHAFLQSISTQESNGNYGAVGVPTRYGTAYGKYQVLDANIEGPGGWDQEALNRDISIQEFLNSPELQEKIAQSKLAQYFKQYGPLGAAKAWYAGPGNAFTNSNAPQYGGPSINGYAQSVVNRMR